MFVFLRFLSYSDGMKHSESLPLFVIRVLVLMLFAVSASIAIPILWRGFYYLHIDALNLPAATGWNRELIREAFDEMMDFCVKSAPFGTGALAWSEEGMQHFADVRKLFQLDLTVFVCSGAALLLLFVLSRRMKPLRIKGRAPSFYAGCGVLLVSAVLTVLAAIDFDRAFVVFHRIFFPGKTNWIFDYRTDQIILVLPPVYFRNCAILAVSVLALICAGYLVTGRKKSQ